MGHTNKGRVTSLFDFFEFVEYIVHLEMTILSILIHGYNLLTQQYSNILSKQEEHRITQNWRIC
jgi:hypothetical protein